ncbi:HpcH/HpaI aldolase family protein [Salinirubrum litoreum]|uniref:HpcH/HpaI aldolase/citrate lyase family protein n=1 Tax=Salinirubrum litoreum TaxID=1126234 RepID=A0ABD5R940_9EURY|nr:aldolase/citrate lyase family protein [Salinirubrum litoreum]
MESRPPNRLRERFETGEVALSVLDNTYSPTLVEFYGDLGVDAVWLDLEHGGPSPLDGPTMEHLLLAAERTGTELLVRLPNTDPTLLRKALDLGVRNVFLPRVESAEEVERAVRSARFDYDGDPGDRGLAAPRARRWGLADDYLTTADREVLVGTTVETPAAVENIDDILAVPDLGFVFAGPFDLSVGVGRPDEIDHPDVTDGIETIRRAAVEAGVPLGGLGFGMDDVNEKAEAGYRLLNLGSTTGALRGVVEGWLGDFEGERSA